MVLFNEGKETKGMDKLLEGYKKTNSGIVAFNLGEFCFKQRGKQDELAYYAIK